MKKILAIGDTHCGSMVGLTHPNWIVRKDRNRQIFNMQTEMWDNYLDILNKFGKVDAVIINGDVIDGKGIKSGGTEQITTDMLEQTDMAIAAFEQIDAKKFYFTYGTPYHTTASSGEDFDKIVANAFNAPIEDELNLSVDNIVFNARHKVGSSSSPYNRASVVGKHRLWDALNSLRESDNTADIYLRSHVHYFSFCGEAQWIAFTLPALQASATKFGARQCVGLTDWGMCLFNVDENGLAGWECHTVELNSSKKKVIRF